MKNRSILFLILIAVLVLGMIGCSGGGSSSGGSTPPPVPLTPTQKLVGTWNFVSSDDGFILGKLVFNANGTGDWQGSGFSGWRIDNGVLYFKLDSGADEAFSLTWTNDNKIILTNHNGGASYTYSRA